MFADVFSICLIFSYLPAYSCNSLKIMNQIRNQKSGQEVAKLEKKKSFAKSDVRYWNPRLFKNSFTHGGQRQETTDWCIRIARNGRRETFNLESPNKEDAAKAAQRIYLSIVAKGWEQALAEFKPTITKKCAGSDIGTLITVCKKLSSRRPETLDAYVKALRRIVAGAFEIEDGRKFDAFMGGRAAWVKQIDCTPIAELTPSKVQAWKNRFLAKAKTHQERNRAVVTVNSLLRNAKALLSKKLLPFIREEIELPSPLFFEGVTAEKEPLLRYKSRIDAAEILRSAKAELEIANPEAYKLLLLTLVFGLRRSEADTLLWAQFDFHKRLLVIEDTDYKRLKSQDSAGEIDLEPELCAIFKSFHEKAEGDFVLENPTRLRIIEVSERKSRGYRCNETHNFLLDWLRTKGVNDRRPIHTMRKEIGSIIASRDGIWKASRYLRHSDIRITSKLYADKKLPVTAGLGSILI
jgi:integrase